MIDAGLIQQSVLSAHSALFRSLSHFASNYYQTFIPNWTHRRPLLRGHSQHVRDLPGLGSQYQPYPVTIPAVNPFCTQIHLYSFAHSQSPQVSFDLMQHFVGPLPQLRLAATASSVIL